MKTNSAVDPYLIGTAYFHIRGRFENPLSINADIPVKSDFSPERNLPLLAMPYKLQQKHKAGGCSDEELEAIFREYIKVIVPDMSGYIERVINKYGPNPVFLGMHKDYNRCHRKIVADIIMQETNFKVIEVTEQYDFVDLDINSIIAGLKTSTSDV